MKKVFLALLAFSSVVSAKDFPVNPSGDGSKYVDEDRFMSTSMANPMDKVITDTKTGCQFLITYGNGVSQIMVGCFEEYKKK